MLKEADTIIHQPASPRSSPTIHLSCPELAENLPDDWVFTASVTNKYPSGFCHGAVLLFKKNLWETPPKQPCFLLTPSFSLVPPRSRQQLSFGDVETASKLLLPCTHGLPASASNLFPWLQTLSGRGCSVPTATSCEGACTTSWRSTPMSCLSSHRPGAWGWFCAGHPPGTHLVMPSLSR